MFNSLEILGANSNAVGNWAKLTLGILLILVTNSSAVSGTKLLLIDNISDYVF